VAIHREAVHPEPMVSPVSNLNRASHNTELQLLSLVNNLSQGMELQLLNPVMGPLRMDSRHIRQAAVRHRAILLRVVMGRLPVMARHLEATVRLQGLVLRPATPERWYQEQALTRLMVSIRSVGCRFPTSRRWWRAFYRSSLEPLVLGVSTRATLGSLSPRLPHVG
jgi:hypothetical protein